MHERNTIRKDIRSLHARGKTKESRLLAPPSSVRKRRRGNQMGQVDGQAKSPHGPYIGFSFWPHVFEIEETLETDPIEEVVR